MHCPPFSLSNDVIGEIQMTNKVVKIDQVKQLFVQGQIIRFRCPIPLNLIGPQYVMCNEGQWTPKIEVSCNRLSQAKSIENLLFP